MATSMQKGDTGIIITFTVYDEDGTTPWDLSGAATTKELILGPPVGSAKVYDASFTTDGTDGKLQYATVDGDIDVAGIWKIQASWVDDGNGNERRSSAASFEVLENIE